MHTEPETAGRSRLSWWLVAAWTIALVVFAMVAHTVPRWGRENDTYLFGADSILAGGLPTDPYHPFGYPFVTALVALVVGDTFVAARLVSCAGAVLLVVAAHRLATLWVGARAASWVAIATALNPWTLTVGVEATTDAVWAGLAAMTLALSAEAVRRAPRTFWLALVFAAAFSTRYQSAVLLVPIVLGLSMSRGVPPRRRWREVLRFVGLAALLTTPHLVSIWIAFGDPFYSENWRSIALKYYGGLEFAALGSMSFERLVEVIAADPGVVVTRSLADLGQLLTATLPRILSGIRDLPASWTGHAAAAFAACGAVVLLVRRDPAFAVVAAFGALYSVLTCVSFVPIAEFYLVLLPVGYVGIVAVARRTGIAHLLGLLSCALVAAALPANLSHFVARHPLPEIAAARTTCASSPVPLHVVSSYPYLARYSGCVLHPVIVPTGREDGWARSWFDRIASIADSANAEWVVLGARLVPTHGDFAALCADVPARFDRVDVGDDSVLLLRSRDAPWVEGLEVARVGSDGSAVRFTVRLRERAGEVAIARVAVLAVGPSGTQVAVELDASGERTYEREVDVAELEAGAWRLTPVVVRGDGSYRAGDPVGWTVTDRDRRAAPTDPRRSK